jgi:hypothetical protein
MNAPGSKARGATPQPENSTADTPVCYRGHRKDGTHRDRVRYNLVNLDHGVEATPWWVRDRLRLEHVRSRRCAA